jgi:hypothetical protein
MAREEQDREDLLRDATAYADRAELDFPGFESPVFFGLRRDGAASVYFSADRVYHFNARGELRRAYLDGLLYKADQGQLVAMARQRSDTETSLESRRLSADETRRLLAGMQRELLQLAEWFASDTAAARRQVTSADTAAHGQTACGRIADWLNRMPQQFGVARSPRVG